MQRFPYFIPFLLKTPRRALFFHFLEKFRAFCLPFLLRHTFPRCDGIHSPPPPPFHPLPLFFSFIPPFLSLALSLPLVLSFSVYARFVYIYLGKYVYKERKRKKEDSGPIFFFPPRASWTRVCFVLLSFLFFLYLSSAIPFTFNLQHCEHRVISDVRSLFSRWSFVSALLSMLMIIVVRIGERSYSWYCVDRRWFEGSHESLCSREWIHVFHSRTDLSMTQTKLSSFEERRKTHRRYRLRGKTGILSKKTGEGWDCWKTFLAAFRSLSFSLL